MRVSQIDERELRKLVEEGHGIREIARRMGHTPGGVSKAAQRLKLAIQEEDDDMQVTQKAELPKTTPVICNHCSYHGLNTNIEGLSLPLDLPMFEVAAGKPSDGFFVSGVPFHQILCPSCDSPYFPYWEAHGRVEALLISPGRYYHVPSRQVIGPDEIGYLTALRELKETETEEVPFFVSPLEIKPRKIGRFMKPLCRLRGTNCAPTCRLYDAGREMCMLDAIVSWSGVDMLLNTPKEAKNFLCPLTSRLCVSTDCFQWYEAYHGVDPTGSKGVCVIEALVRSIGTLFARGAE